MRISMATVQFPGASATRSLPPYEGLRPSMVRVSSVGPCSVGLNRRHFQGLVVRAVTVDAPEKLGVVVKPIEKPRLVLKFIWLEKNIGLALDQVIPGHGTIPLSPYYFWPRKDAWEELKTKLENKPWISQKRMIILLNQATDIINLWQQSGGNLS
ncbi:small ribosomal subunit protein cS23-like isoform X1 [Magnolia sinica]|uniref:small ribosomal subunit protein cS23-like isoform X1 n=2 Tax=Magnolia sinica TaxID=86752 RepID=UPI00265AF7F2|nr:small ribosomal subunit protein cS23-like isoform X1 [Magnolia sinica]